MVLVPNVLANVVFGAVKDSLLVANYSVRSPMGSLDAGTTNYTAPEYWVDDQPD